MPVTHQCNKLFAFNNNSKNGGGAGMTKRVSREKKTTTRLAPEGASLLKTTHTHIQCFTLINLELKAVYGISCNKHCLLWHVLKNSGMTQTLYFCSVYKPHIFHRDFFAISVK